MTLEEIIELCEGNSENYDLDIDEFECVKDDSWEQNGKYQYRSAVYKVVGQEVYFEVSESRSGSYHSDWYYSVPEFYLVDKPIVYVKIPKDELKRLRSIEKMVQSLKDIPEVSEAYKLFEE
ncbi:MAG: hypothetical protein [Caudoviricetes sp.]|nr:MAG: hypothetical protein [Caudoviricetes sp.]